MNVRILYKILTTFIILLALYGASEFLYSKPWKNKVIVVKNQDLQNTAGSAGPLQTASGGKKSLPAVSLVESVSSYEEPTSLLQKGLALVGVGESGENTNEELKRAMEEYFISSAEAFPSKDEIPIALSIAREGNMDALEIAINDMKKGLESLKLLMPPKELESFHHDTILLVEFAIADLEKLMSLPLPDEKLFREYFESDERKNLREHGLRLANDMKSFIQQYKLNLPDSAFGL